MSTEMWAAASYGDWLRKNHFFAVADTREEILAAVVELFEAHGLQTVNYQVVSEHPDYEKFQDEENTAHSQWEDSSEDCEKRGPYPRSDYTKVFSLSSLREEDCLHHEHGGPSEGVKFFKLAAAPNGKWFENDPYDYLSKLRQEKAQVVP